MDRQAPLPTDEIRRERIHRIRIGATGLAFIVLLVLLAVSISGTASNEPELTPEAIAEQQAAETGESTGDGAQPQEPLAELGVAPPSGPVEGPAPGEGEGAAPPVD